MATDRLSAFDVVLPTGIPGKGVRAHAALALLVRAAEATWCRTTCITADVDDYPAALRRVSRPARGPLDAGGEDRAAARSSAWCAATSPAPAGRTTRRPGSVCGIALPAGPARVGPPRAGRSSRRPPRPRPATTRTSRSRDGGDVWARARGGAARPEPRDLRARARAHAEARGIILADTKFEFGVRDGRAGLDRRGPDARLVALLAARRATSRAGRSPASTSSTCATTSRPCDWDKQPPAPSLPGGRGRTREKYVEAYARLTDGRRRGTRRTTRRVARGGDAGHRSTRASGRHADPRASARRAGERQLREAAAGVAGLRDGRQGHPLLGGPPRVREALHRARAAAAPRATCPGPPRTCASTATPSARRSRSTSSVATLDAGRLGLAAASLTECQAALHILGSQPGASANSSASRSGPRGGAPQCRGFRESTESLERRRARMNVRPLHDRLLVKRIEEKETVKGGIIIPDTAKEKPQEGEVIAVGNGKILENGTKVAAGRQGRRQDPVRQVLGHRDQDRRRGVPDPARGRSPRGRRLSRARNGIQGDRRTWRSRSRTATSRARRSCAA